MECFGDSCQARNQGCDQEDLPDWVAVEGLRGWDAQLKPRP
jgi:hypothetical protein